jgi:hypothetical protein
VELYIYIYIYIYIFIRPATYPKTKGRDKFGISSIQK